MRHVVILVRDLLCEEHRESTWPYFNVDSIPISNRIGYLFDNEVMN